MTNAHIISKVSKFVKLFHQVSDCCLMPTQQFHSYICISWREQVNLKWDDDEVRFVLDQLLSWIFIVLAHWNNSPRIDMSPYSWHIILITS